MSETIVDSSIVIDYLRGRRVAQEFLDGLRVRDELATHVVVVAEVLAGARNLQELIEIDRAVKVFRMVPIGAEDSFASLELYKRHRPEGRSRLARLPDRRHLCANVAADCHPQRTALPGIRGASYGAAVLTW